MVDDQESELPFWCTQMHPNRAMQALRSTVHRDRQLGLLGCPALTRAYKPLYAGSYFGQRLFSSNRHSLRHTNKALFLTGVSCLTCSKSSTPTTTEHSCSVGKHRRSPPLQLAALQEYVIRSVLRKSILQIQTPQKFPMDVRAVASVFDVRNNLLTI